MINALKKLFLGKHKTKPEGRSKPAAKAVHTCIDRQGNHVPIARMSDNYLLNNLKFTRRKAQYLISVVQALEAEAVTRGLNFTKEDI